MDVKDHRIIGRQLDLFHQQEDAPGTVFWHPKGWRLWQTVESYMRQKMNMGGYQEVKTPQLVHASLFDKSGHTEKFSDSMFMWDKKVLPDGYEDQAGLRTTFALKPMNCPCHVQIFNVGTKSYRALPLRLSEFGSCHRNEPDGSLHGLMRVRAFTQDDGHIFCTPDQIESEVADFMRMAFAVYETFGFKGVKVQMSTRPEKRLGTEEQWDQAEAALSRCMHLHTDSEKYQAKIVGGGGAFYGPKIEFSVTDLAGREWQLGTIQLDFNLPERLGARYVGEDNKEHVPVMLHRAILGSMERFIGILLENYPDGLPLWLAPVQVAVLPVSKKSNDYAKNVTEDIRTRTYNFLNYSDVVVELNDGNDKLGAKIRDAEMKLVPYIVVVGPKEKESQRINVRSREYGELDMDVADFANALRLAMATKAFRANLNLAY